MSRERAAPTQPPPGRELGGSYQNAGEAQSHRRDGEREHEGEAMGFNSSLSLPACFSAGWEESYSQHMFLLAKETPNKPNTSSAVLSSICFYRS